MKLNSLSRPLVCAFALGALSVSAWADGINARVKSVDPVAHTITVIEKQEDHVFSVTDATKFINGDGDVLATGLKMGDNDALEMGVKTGRLKAGTRLSITFDKVDDKFVASQVQLRDLKREVHQ